MSEMEQLVSQSAGRINGAYGEADWTPIRYVNRAYSRTALAGLYRAARVGLVTPLRDGMNLVAKEYVAAQDPDDPGVLVLSRFAGAAHECKEALLVNPYDTEAVAAAINRALAMPLEERRARHQTMFETLTRNDIAHWAERFIATLTRPRAESWPFGTGSRGGMTAVTTWSGCRPPTQARPPHGCLVFAGAPALAPCGAGRQLIEPIVLLP